MSNETMYFADARLARVMNGNASSCASVSEYARITGIPTLELVRIFTNERNKEHVELEAVAGELFVLTKGNNSHGNRTVAANLWEQLRENHSEHDSAHLWSLIRALENAGWRTEANYSILARLGPATASCSLAVRSGDVLIPVVTDIDETAVSRPSGILTHLSLELVPMIAIMIPSGTLDSYITSVREWYFAFPQTGARVALLEAPTYAPVVVSGADASVAPRNVTIDDLPNL
jgi:hypothetical protein